MGPIAVMFVAAKAGGLLARFVPGSRPVGSRMADSLGRLLVSPLVPITKASPMIGFLIFLLAVLAPFLYYYLISEFNLLGRVITLVDATIVFLIMGVSSYLKRRVRVDDPGEV
jgi:hypothetical protein